MGIRNDSTQNSPGGTPIPALTDVQAAELVALGSRWRREKAWYPLPAASPAPLTTDAGIQVGAPSPTTGLKFVPWSQLGAFNFQGNYIIQGGTAIASSSGLTASSICQNASTPRKYNFGTLNGDFQPSTMNVRFITDSTRVIPQWYYTSAMNGSAYNDMHMMVEHDGEMKHLSSSSSTADGMPRTDSNSAGVKRRELTFLQRRPKQIRLILSGFCYFAGVWIDTLATITKAPNRDLFMHNMDSWNEPTGASWSDNPGGGFPSGSYQCLGMPEYCSFETGQAHGTYAQGGTGEANDNGTGNNATGYTGTSFSAAWSDSRVLDAVTKFGPQSAIQLDVGGWNDGNLLGTPYKDTYKARIQARLTKFFNAAASGGYDMREIMVGIQPCDWIPGDGGFRDLSEQGQAEMPAVINALYPGKHLGYVPIKSMWDDRSTSGQRSILCLSQSGVYIHLNVSGNMSVAAHITSQMAQLKAPRAFLEKQRAWAG